MDAFQRLPGGAVPNPLSTTTGAQPAPSSQGQYLGHDVTSPPGTLSTPGMAPVYPHASAMVSPSTSQPSPARVSALSGTSGTSTGQQGISVTVDNTNVVVKNGFGETLYSVAKGDKKNKPKISMLNLAGLAICQQPGKKATIKQMASWVKEYIPYSYKDTECGIKSALIGYQCEISAKTEGSGKSQVRLWALKDEEEFFQYAGSSSDNLSKRVLKKHKSVCPGPLTAPGVSPVLFDTTGTDSPPPPQRYPTMASYLGTASGSGASARHQGISVKIGEGNILIKDANDQILHRVIVGSADEGTTTSQVCLTALAICYQNDKKATASQITLWLQKHIPSCTNKQYGKVLKTVTNELHFYKTIFRQSPRSASQHGPVNWELIDETAYFLGTETKPPIFKNFKRSFASAALESQPPAAKKSHYQPESSAGTLSASDVSMGGPLQPFVPPFAGGSSTASYHPASTGPIPPVSYLFSGEYPVPRDQPVGPESFYPGPATPAPFPQHYPGVRYQPAGPGAYPGPPPPYPFSGGHPVSYPQPFPGTVYPMPSAAFGDLPYEPEPGSFIDSALPPYYPPVVVTTANY